MVLSNPAGNYQLVSICGSEFNGAQSNSNRKDFVFTARTKPNSRSVLVSMQRSAIVYGIYDSER